MAGIEYLSPEGLRVDGRRSQELRKLQCRVGIFKQADGSSFLEQGNTKVLASVYGPHDVSQRTRAIHDRASINCQCSMASFSTSERRRRTKGDRLLKLLKGIQWNLAGHELVWKILRAVELSQSLKQTFESIVITDLFPQSEININIQVLQSDGGDCSVCVNAATVALMDAGIPMRDFISACSASYIEDTPILDVNYLEENAGGPNLTVAILPKSAKIILLQMESKLHSDNLHKILDNAVDGCQKVYQVLDTIVKSNLEKAILTVK